jgi:5'-deoxynucleotidase YfbR-like HD superfamily hydrolase
MSESFAKRGYWFQTYSGRRVYPFDPRPEDYYLADIAHSLALKCRFSGHCLQHYSVAQHSVLVSRHLPPRLAGWGLLHDAPEMSVGDWIRPLKKGLLAMGVDALQAIERGIMGAVAEKFDLPPLTREDEEELDRIDLAALATEARHFMHANWTSWEELESVRPLDGPLETISWREAEATFLLRSVDLGLYEIDKRKEQACRS